MKDVRKALLAEMGCTAALLFCVTAVSISVDRAALDNHAIGLLVTSVTTAFAMLLLLKLAEPISGGYLNPLAAGILALRGNMSPHERVPYTALLLLVQVLGAFAGAWLANLLFGMAGGEMSVIQRSATSDLIGEAAAAFGLALVISLSPPSKRILLMSIYSGVIYWVTPSTSFANPAAALARVFTEGLMGVSPGSALAAIGAQVISGGAGVALAGWLAPLHTRN